MIDELPVASRIRYKILLMVPRTQQGRATMYLCGLMCKPTSAVSLRPLSSLDRLDLFVSWTGQGLLS